LHELAQQSPQVVLPAAHEREPVPLLTEQGSEPELLLQA
jgi:hypothetical protein